jgi:hypothetical protein
MISQLASPSVCVIDNEAIDYEPILGALNALFVSTVHLSGAIDELPAQPFDKLRLVFLDLHLTASVGKDAASYTANVFRRVVYNKTAPVVVVIWSKYANDRVAEHGVPPEDQDTEAQVFKNTLLEAAPEYLGRLIFIEMAKPKQDDRPEDWTAVLKTEINNALQGQSAVELLWAWDSLISEGSAQVSRGLTAVAQAAVSGTALELKDGLKATMQRLANAQSEGDFSAATAPRHLITVLTELLVDQLEHPDGIAGVAAHGVWLSENPPGAVTQQFPAHINGFLMTAGVSADQGLYAPGTVFRITDATKFEAVLGKPVSSLVDICCRRGPQSPRLVEWRAAAQAVLIELSPVCDVAQGHRVSSLLVGGVVVPVAFSDDKKQENDTFGSLESFNLRWAGPNFPEQDVMLAFCNRYKTTLPAGTPPDWLQPWFRLRDLPVASIRNSNSAHAARVGFVSLR